MPDLIGKTLGPYRIVSQIGLGGMATVYKAYQPSMDRYVALKVLSTHLTQDPAFIKRFEQEAKIIAKLEHLNILPVYDHGEQDGYLYLVMRYIEAGTLTDRLKQGRPALDQVRRVVTQVGSALEYAHQLGVVHRDVKPSNVLVDPQGDCYLTDFGIARMVEGTLGLTGSGVIGTPHYMAPEQSKSRQVDHRADIYAMGVVIYEMVTGRVPYDAETPFAVVMKHLIEPLPLPRSIRPDLPEAVERVILKALAKDPSERYQSMRDLVAAFDEAARQAPAFEAPSAVDKPLPTTTLMRGTAPAPAWRRWLTDQPSWLLPGAGLALIVLIVAGVILSRIPGRVEISGGQVQVVTSTPAAVPTSASMVQPTPTGTIAALVQTSAPQPTMQATPPSSAISTGPCRIAFVDKQKGGDIYVQDCNGANWRRVTEGRVSTHEPSWSPDGQRLVFDDPEGQPDRNHYVPTYLRIVNADGSNLTLLVSPDGPVEGNFPSWSPDGTRIAFQSGADLYTVHPDGTGRFHVLTHQDLSGAGDAEIYADRPVWSPDSQRIAFSTFPADTVWQTPPPGPHEYRFYVVNADGTGLIKLASFKLDAPEWWWKHAFWSPDGKYVGMEVMVDDKGTTKRYQMNADGSGKLVEVPSISESWYPWQWPQWGGKAQPAPSLQAEQARTFAEPILKAIANRSPDFADDFSSTDKNWETGFGEQGTHTGKVEITNGVARMTLVENSDGFINTGLELKSFALTLDGKQLGGSPKSVQQVFVGHPSGGWMMLDLTSTGSWNLTKLPSAQEISVVKEGGKFTPSMDNMVRIAIVVQGSRFAAFVNDEPIVFAEDKDFDKSNQVWFMCRGEPDIVCEFDNVQFWNLDNVPGLPSPVSANPQVEQARAFAEPILAAIANRPPDFVDDFAADNKGWQTAGSKGTYDITVQDGVARLRADMGGAYLSHEMVQRKDFVLQMDARLVEGDKEAEWQVMFHNQSGEHWYAINLSSVPRTWYVKKRLAGQESQFASGVGDVSPLGETTRIVVATRGPRAAFYLNETPVAYFEDADFDTSGMTMLWCMSTGQVVCEFDNVTFWNLDNVPGLP